MMRRRRSSPEVCAPELADNDLANGFSLQPRSWEVRGDGVGVGFRSLWCVCLLRGVLPQNWGPEESTPLLVCVLLPSRTICLTPASKQICAQCLTCPVVLAGRYELTQCTIPEERPAQTRDRASGRGFSLCGHRCVSRNAGGRRAVVAPAAAAAAVSRAGAAAPPSNVPFILAGCWSVSVKIP